MCDTNDDKKFQKNVKPVFCSKVKGNRTITSVEDSKVVTIKSYQTYKGFFIKQAMSEK